MEQPSRHRMSQREGISTVGDALGPRLFMAITRLVPEALQPPGEPLRVLRRSPTKPSSLVTITCLGSDTGCVVQVKHQYLMKGAKRESLHVLEVDAARRTVAPRSVQRPDGTALDLRRGDSKRDEQQALKLALTTIEHLLAEGWADRPNEPLPSP